MKPQGLRAVHFPGKKDHHLKKDGLINWWEAISRPNKTREKRLAMKEAHKEINEAQ